MFNKTTLNKIFKGIWLGLVLTIALVLTSCVPPVDGEDPVDQDVTVRFIVDGVVVKTENIPFRSSATAPSDPVKDNYVFVGWDKSFTDVRGHLDVHAIFQPIRYTFTKTDNVKITVVRDGKTIVLANGDLITRGETITVSVIIPSGESFKSLVINDEEYENNAQIVVLEDLEIIGSSSTTVLTPKELLNQDILALGTTLGEKTTTFTLPSQGQNGSSITWSVVSGNSIVIEDGVAIVTRPTDANETVTLKAHFVLGEETKDVEVTVIIIKEQGSQPNVYATDLFISEYAEGAVGNNKYIEIFNATGVTVNLKGYEVKLYANGATQPTQTLTFTDIYLPHGSVFVIYNSDSAPEIVSKLTNGLAMDSTVTYFNGNDAIELLKNGTVIDIIGLVGDNPSSGGWTGKDANGNNLTTLNQTLIREKSITSPNATFTPEEWVTLGTDIFTNVNEHEFEFIELTPEQIIQSDLARLSLPSQATSNLDLPLVGVKGSTITWESLNTKVITHDGIVTRGDETVTVTLIATLSYEGVYITQEFTVKVLGKTSSPTLEYYADAEGLVGQALESALRKIITDTHTTKITYKNLNSYYSQTDYDPFNPHKALLFYTRLDAKDHSWNKEHVWPDSKGGNKAENDLHHIRPTVSTVNSQRGSYTIGIVTSSKKEIVYNGINTGNFYGGGRFEPADNIKGDVARIIFYCATRYADMDIVSSGVADLNTLLIWNMLDLPDEYEFVRNEAIYGIQGNRNPFIDYPEFANLIWG